MFDFVLYNFSYFVSKGFILHVYFYLWRFCTQNTNQAKKSISGVAPGSQKNFKRVTYILLSNLKYRIMSCVTPIIALLRSSQKCFIVLVVVISSSWRGLYFNFFFLFIDKGGKKNSNSYYVTRAIVQMVPSPFFII